MVLRGSGAFVGRRHVVQVAAVFVPTVVQGLAFEKSRRRGKVGDGGHGQVVVGVRRGVLGRVGEVLLGSRGVRVMVGGRRVELHVGERVSHRALRRKGPSRRVEAQGR